jgi:hypothetical protein
MNKKEFTNPFSDAFIQYWDIWKQFKKEEFNFEYKGVISQQMAVKQLVDLSEGDEERAIKILCQSVRRRWQGFWPLHETTTGNGKSKSTKEGQPNGDSLENRVTDEFNKRFGDRQQSPNGSNLKAV